MGESTRVAGGDGLGLYVHVPFCKARCVYCDFYVETGMERHFQDYSDAVLTEWQMLRSEVLPSPPRVTSVYFGGGTPSLLPEGIISRLLDAVGRDVYLESDVEVTLEANPESVSREKALSWRSAGVNRVSLGIQSLRAGDLSLLRRLHTVDQALEAARSVRGAGQRLGLDFIYGLREGASDAYRQSVEQALDLDPEHLSCYLLTVEEGTPLARLVKEGRWSVAADEEASDDYRWTRDRLRAKGYEAYEISNFAKPGHRSRHNQGYWERSPYLGIGPGAHSFHGGKRWSNVASVERYLESVLRDGMRPTTGEEVITPRREAEEWIFLGLRMAQGVRWSRLRPLLPRETWDRLEGVRHELMDRGLLEEHEGWVRLTEEAIFLSNAVMVELLCALEPEEAPEPSPGEEPRESPRESEVGR